MIKIIIYKCYISDCQDGRISNYKIIFTTQEYMCLETLSVTTSVITMYIQ